MSRLLLLPVFLGIAFGGLHAQTASPSPADTTSRQALWRCTLPGGNYEVSVRSIVSVSSHEYIVDGVARVTEVNVDTVGNSMVRFYYLEPLTPNSPIGLGQSVINKAQDVAQQIASRTGQEETWKKVMKNYPTSTHAHTVEYRLDSKDDADKIYKSAEESFRLLRNGTVTLP